MPQDRKNAGAIFLIVGRLALAAVFLYAAYVKLKPQGGMGWSLGSLRVSLSMFAMQVDSYQLLPPWGVNAVAHLLPPFELFLGLWLLTGIALRFSSLVTALLLSGFFTGMVRAYVLGQEISCGCFGPGEQIGPRTLLRDGTLLAVALAVTIGAFLIHRRKEASTGPASLPPGRTV
ncbi:MAG TPA: MauE/DoxX family redox-associated membrane protein [Candidatus Acidoferrum sp.]|nr:MauE/DoxX family redox-associated membrane protein [Candidatus Acidoferrum sp.]